MMIQMYLNRWIFNPLCGLMSRCTQKVKDGMFLSGGVLIFAVLMMRGAGLGPSRFIISFALGCLGQGLMILGALPNEMKPVRISRPLALFWFGTTLLMIWPVFRYNLDNLAELLYMMIAMPVTWLVWAQSDFSSIFKKLCRISRWSFCAFLVISAVLYPITKEQYSGLFNNVNGTAFFLAPVFCCLLAEITEKGQKLSRRIWYTVLIGICFSMIFYTNSRTGLLAVLCAVAMYIIMLFCTERLNAFKILAKVILPVVLSSLLFTPVTVHLFAATAEVTYPIRAVYEEYLKEHYPSRVKKPNSGKKPGSKPDGIDGFLAMSQYKGNMVDKSLDAYSTGRISVWKAFASHIRLFGSEPVTSCYIPCLHRNIATAHNTFITFGVDYGLFCAIFYFLFCIVAGLKSIRFTVKEKNRPYSTFILLTTITYGVICMLATVNTPFWYTISVYYYFVQGPLFFTVKEDSRPKLEEK